MLNKPVEVTSTSTKNSTEKKWSKNAAGILQRSLLGSLLRSLEDLCQILEDLNKINDFAYKDKAKKKCSGIINRLFSVLVDKYARTFYSLLPSRQLVKYPRVTNKTLNKVYLFNNATTN